MLVLRKRVHPQFTLIFICVIISLIVSCDQSKELDNDLVKIILSKGRNYNSNVVWDPDDAFKEVKTSQYYT